MIPAVPEMTGEEIARWKLDHPTTRFECTTFKAQTPAGKVFAHSDELPNGDVVGIAFSTQGTRKDSMMGRLLDSITESLEATNE